MNIELLPVSRWGEIERALKESRSDEELPKPENSVMLGGFEGDQLAGVIGAEKVWCVSPFWTAQEQRGNGLAQRLAIALDAYVPEGMRAMCATTNPHVERILFDMKFVPIEGQLWRQEVRYLK